MSHKKTVAVRTKKGSAQQPGRNAPGAKAPVRKKPLWQIALRTAFYVIMSAMILVTIVHYAQHYMHLVRRR